MLRIKKEHNRIPFERQELKKDIDSLLEADDFLRFSELLGGPHSAIHVLLECTMQFVQTAAYDPIFWLHHSFIDKVWADRQNNPDLEPMTGTKEYLDDSILSPFQGSQLPPFSFHICRN